MFGANFEIVGRASVVVPREASRIEDRHGGCAPLLGDDAPSVATSPEFYLKAPRRVVRSLCPVAAIQTQPLHGRWIADAPTC